MINPQQQQIDFGKALKDEGMKRAVDHADQVHGGWQEEAFNFFKLYASRIGKRFMAEDVRQAAVGIVPDPPHRRAWGAIVNRAAKAGLIRQVGFAPVKNPKAHRAPCGVWIAIKPAKP